ncbi:MAG: ABC transporter substrate-binding protein [Syntrophaceae bacterium]|nr:ABC transporter substrate-binding protein [Syntrophaceae bacterium]
MKRTVFFLGTLLVLFFVKFPAINAECKELRLAVEFNDHAASAYVAKDKGWFEEAGLNVENYESYATGVALAAAMARGEIQAAFMCLIPAINTYANGKVPIRIISGTHQYGYGLVVNPTRIKQVNDLALPGIRIGCVRQGGTVDVLMAKTIEQYNLPREIMLNNVKRMPPSKMVWALKINQLDAIFVPEHWASLAESFGFKMLLTSQDIWPQMIGSVLIVSQSLIDSDPETIDKLIAINEKAIQWINKNPEEASKIVARHLSNLSGESNARDLSQESFASDVTEKVIRKSMSRLVYTTTVDPKEVQRTINYLDNLGYLQRKIQFQDILH